MTSQPRVSAGVPTGGQFATAVHAESPRTLGTDTGAKPGDLHAAVAALNESYGRWRNAIAESEAASRRVAAAREEFAAAMGRLRQVAPGVAADAEEEVAWRDAEHGDHDPADLHWRDVSGTEVYDSRHPDVQAGKVFDAVSSDGTVFHRRREGVYPDWPYAMRFQASRPLSDDEVQRFAQLVGYQYRASVRGEPLGWPERDTPYSFVVAADCTKTSSDDIGIALEEFEDNLTATVLEGSPVRKTDRSGPGTRGTRLIEGFNEPDLTFHVYYDRVCI